MRMNRITFGPKIELSVRLFFFLVGYRPPSATIIKPRLSVMNPKTNLQTLV